jgi:ParB family chromosome partitioning protein
VELEFHQIAMKYEGLRISMPGFQARLMASLAEEGQLNPVLVVEAESEGYVLIDGYHRVSALRALGRDTVETMVLPLCESAALIFRHCQENAHKRSALEDGWLLVDLVDVHGMSQAELSRRLQRSESWVSRRVSLVRELPESAQELVRRGKLCGDAAMKYLVPLSRGKRSHCEELVGNLEGRRTSARELERIYMSWKSGDAEQRKRVITNPQLFLKTAEELKSEPDKRVGDDIQKVFDDMEILDAASCRARRRIRGLRGCVALPDTVIEAWRSVQSSFAALCGAMEKRVNAGHGNKNGNSAPQG